MAIPPSANDPTKFDYFTRELCHYIGDVCCHARDLADFGPSLTDSSHFFSRDGPDLWMCYNCHERPVISTHYAILIHFILGPGYHHPKSWVIEIAAPHSHSGWVEIDRKIDSSDLHGPNRVRIYDMKMGLAAVRIHLR
jgi:hypothetical protein